MFKVMMAENFLKLMLDKRPQIQRAQRTPTRLNTEKKNSIARYRKLNNIQASENIEATENQRQRENLERSQRRYTNGQQHMKRY